MSLLMETDPGAKASVPVGILLGQCQSSLGDHPVTSKQSSLPTTVTGSGSMHLETLDLSICVGRSVQCGLTRKQNCSLQFRPILENGGTDFPNPQKQNTIVKL